METGRTELAQVGNGLTDRQKRLVEGLLSGLSDNEALSAAGYEKCVPIGTVTASEPVQAALKSGRKSSISGYLAQKALKRVEALITDDRTPAATALAASKWVLEQAGHGSQVDDGHAKPMNEMTEDELLAFIAKAAAVVDRGGEPPIITITPHNGAHR